MLGSPHKLINARCFKPKRQTCTQKKIQCLYRIVDLQSKVSMHDISAFLCTGFHDTVHHTSVYNIHWNSSRKSIVQVFSEEPEFGCAEIVIPTPGLGEYEMNVLRDVLMIAIHKVQVPPLVEGGCE